MKFFTGESLFTWAGAKVNRTIALMCKLRVHQAVDYNHIMILGISPKHISEILSQPKPSGEELAALVFRVDKEKQKYDHFLSEDLLDHEYAATYLDVDKAWSKLQKLSAQFGPEDFYNDDTSEEVGWTSEKGDSDKIFDFRHIRDISNVIKYDTLDDPLNEVILGYIRSADLGCEVKAGVMFPNAPAHAMPINFLLHKGDKEVAILLLHGSKIKRYSVQETEALCSENGVDVMRFYFEYDNESDYVIERIRKALS